MPTIEVTDATFESSVLTSNKPVLVDFWATWCGPCKAVAPILEELADEYADSVTIAKLDVDASPGIAQALRIQSIPTMILFVDGQPVKAVQGALPRESLVKFIEEHVPSLKKPDLTVEQLAELLDAKTPVALFDIRDTRDVSRSHLRGAKAIAPDQIASALTALDQNQLVVLICRTGEQSLELAKKLNDPRVLALQKGLLEWEGSGRPTYSDKEEAALSPG